MLSSNNLKLPLSMQFKINTEVSTNGLLIQKNGEPDIKVLKFFMTEAINEGIEIENGKNKEKRKSVTSKQVGRILTEVGLSGTANKIMTTISESIQTDDTSKNE